ncbi:phage terminase large subunit [Streptomyces sp. STCH 565 A]|uniref:phage terminase large subunit n=1 Tax=Streptomyces sp. STCH 565 A TaxID=2950532 RepID=UPI0020764DFB|nr:phage terminase large subunit [Streptomyces sp. STCH 565 A]MCM8555352.1 phage terminase large subunit [Streptomyces sp. STCH 565 A]
MTTALDQDAIVRYEPRGAARDLFRARQSEVFMAGPAGTGKSLACLFRLHLTALNNPDMRGLIFRKTAVSLGSTTLVTWEKKVIADALARGIVSWFGGSAREAPGYRYSNGSKIDVAGMDKPAKIMSAEYDLVFGDEATELTLDDWESVGTRLRNGKLAWQQQMGACNPSAPTHWIKQRCDQGAARMMVSRHRDNPAYVNADGTPTEVGRAYFQKLDALTGVRKARLRDGTWAAAEGLIYGEFNDAVHLVDPFKIPVEWTRWITVDFGFTNPAVIQWWAEDPDGRLYLYRELYHTRCLVEDLARQAKELMQYPSGQWREPRPRAVICDHDAEDRATLEKHLGLSTTAANKKVSPGIQALQARLKVQADGRPRFFIVRGALVERDPALDEAKKPCSTEEEITGYVWAVKPGGTVPEVPLKENDHGMDAGRYMVAERDLGGRPQLRFVG